MVLCLDMFRIFTVLFISSVCVFVLCEGQFNNGQQLEFEITRIRGEIIAVNRDSERLRQETKQLIAICVDKITMNKRFISNSSDEIQAQRRTLEHLYQQLAESYAEEDRLKEAPADIERLKLGIMVVQEDIQVLQERREDETAKSSLELLHMTANTSEARPPSVLTWMRLCDTPVDLENQLRLARSNLAEANRRRAEEYRTLECTRDRCNKIVQALVDMLEELGNDSRKAQERVNEIKKELEKQKKRLAELINSRRTRDTEQDKWNMKEAKKFLDKYQQYALEVYSYKILVYYVQTSVLSEA